MNFKDKIAIVTGGSDGIGLGISEELARREAKVYLVARHRDKLERAQHSIVSKGGRAEIRQADVTVKGEVERIIDDVYANEGRLDFFVNNAGTYKSANTQTPWTDIERILDLDFTSPMRLTHYLAGKAKEELMILTVLSQAANVMFPEGIAYGTAKKALATGLLEYEHQLAVEGKTNIRMSRLYPGTVATPAMMGLIREGRLQNATTVDSVVRTAMGLLEQTAVTRDAYVGYRPGLGIVAEYYQVNPKEFRLLGDPVERETIDSDFNPSSLT